jgi:hypothetical protein
MHTSSLKVVKYPHRAIKLNNYNNEDISNEETCPAFSKHTGIPRMIKLWKK